jgi:acetyltransferase-like isoleucine patch superfamily enzyme
MLRVMLARLRSHGRVRAAGRVRIGRGVRFHIGAGATLGERCVIAAHERVEVGAGAQLDDEVVLIDFDHGVADVERPIRLQGLVTSPVVIGERAVLASGATVLRGVVVGPGARVLPRGVVTHDVAAGATVAGLPARPV